MIFDVRYRIDFTDKASGTECYPDLRDRIDTVDAVGPLAAIMSVREGHDKRMKERSRWWIGRFHSVVSITCHDTGQAWDMTKCDTAYQVLKGEWETGLPPKFECAVCGDIFECENINGRWMKMSGQHLGAARAMAPDIRTGNGHGE